MPKRRLGIVLLVPAAPAAEVDTLRRAVGDPALARIPPHITLVPPVNVNDERLGDALAVVRAAGAAARPLSLTLGPAASFLPVNPVLYLAVGGDVDGVVDLRQRLLQGPLDRPVDHEFVPHVTLADGIEAARVEAGVAALRDYRASITVARVHVLEQHEGRQWRPLADAPLGPPAVVGRGGLPVELTVSDQLEPAAAAVLDAPCPFVITARRDGRPVGVATGTTDHDDGLLVDVGVLDGERGQGIGAKLLAAAESLAAERGCTTMRAAAPHPFLARHGWVDGRRREL